MSLWQLQAREGRRLGKAGQVPPAAGPGQCQPSRGQTLHLEPSQCTLHASIILSMQGQAYCPPYAATYTTAAECDAAILTGVQAAEELGIELSKHGINAGQNSTAESAMLTGEQPGHRCVDGQCQPLGSCSACRAAARRPFG